MKKILEEVSIEAKRFAIEKKAGKVGEAQNGVCTGGIFDYFICMNNESKGTATSDECKERRKSAEE